MCVCVCVYHGENEVLFVCTYYKRKKESKKERKERKKERKIHWKRTEDINIAR